MNNKHSTWFLLFVFGFSLTVSGFVMSAQLGPLLSYAMKLIGCLAIFVGIVGRIVAYANSPKSVRSVDGAEHAQDSESSTRNMTAAGLFGTAGAAAGYMYGSGMSTEELTTHTDISPRTNTDGTPMMPGGVFDINGDAYGAPQSLMSGSDDMNSFMNDSSSQVTMDTFSSGMNDMNGSNSFSSLD